MLKKFVFWIICFGLSCFVAYVLEWTDQSRAFFYMYLGITVVIVIFKVLVMIVSHIEKLLSTRISNWTVAIIALASLASWIATKLFGVDFFVTFQIMTFGACLTREHLKAKDSDD